jgi:hypothetical protein
MLFYVAVFLIVNNMTLSISCTRSTENKLLTYLLRRVLIFSAIVECVSRKKSVTETLVKKHTASTVQCPRTMDRIVKEFQTTVSVLTKIKYKNFCFSKIKCDLQQG